MENLFKQLGGQAGFGSIQGLLGGLDSQDNEEELEDDQLMENAKLTHDVFI